MTNPEKEKIEKVLNGKRGNVGRRSKNPGSEVVLAEYADHSASELAKKYGVAENTIRVWIREARKELKDE